MKQDVFIGNYSEQGISKLEFSENKNLKEASKIGDLKKSFYVCKYKNFLYSVTETGGDDKVNSGYVVSYKLNNNEINFINTTTSYGKSPCFLIVDPLREILYVANYSDGSFVAFKLNEDGSIGEKIYYEKFGDISRVHHIQFSKDYKSVYIVDLGEDCIIEYNIEYSHIKLNLTEKSRYYFPKKSEPRHMVMDKENNIYIVTEKSCEVYKLSHDSKEQIIIDEKKLILPKGTKKEEEYTGCAIKIDSKMQYMYISVRGHNSISVFNIENGNIELIQNVKSQGDTPTDIAFDKYEKYLFCANKVSDNISLFSIKNGLLSYENDYKIEAPTCIVID